MSRNTGLVKITTSNPKYKILFRFLMSRNFRIENKIDTHITIYIEI
jgi:hypothetical protein